MIRIFKLGWLFFLLVSCGVRQSEVRDKLPLSGEWKFRIDSLDEGIEKKWYNDMAVDTVRLPGSMAENGKGDEVSLKTDWTGEIVDRSYFTDKKYEKYRQPGNIKIPFWLKPVKYYKGVAWYQKEVEIPSGWNKKDIILFLERPHWESTVYVNGKKAGIEKSLAVAHQFDITDLLIPGKNLISIRIDNRVVIPIGINSHSITDHTQTNWNGMVGDISLIATSKVSIRNMRVYPDLKGGKAKVIVALSNKSGTSFNGEIDLQASSFNSGVLQKLGKSTLVAKTDSNDIQLIIDFPMGKEVQEWSEFRPVLYKLSVKLRGAKGETVDTQTVDFGMRNIKANGTRFEMNDRQIFLRGTLECCIFPLTGYPPTDVKSWLKVLQTFKDYGLNTVRFHSWCPPEAAFIAGC